MGTSRSYSGPGRNSPLLPPWADDGDGAPPPESSEAQPANGIPPNQQPAPSQPNYQPSIPATVNLTSARQYFGEYARGGGGGSLRKGARAYVQGMGGAKNAARASRAGRRATKRLGAFLVDVATRGIQSALDNLNLGNAVGRSAEEVLAIIAGMLAPTGNSLDDAAAQSATSETLKELYKQYSLGDGDLSNLDAMDADGVRNALHLSVTSYIYEKLLNVTQSNLDEHNMSDEALLKAEREIRLFVKESVNLDLNAIDVMSVDWNGSEGEQITQQIYEQAYTVWEAMLT